MSPEIGEIKFYSDVMVWLKKIGAVKDGHFVLTSGKHSDIYVNKDGAYPYVVQVSQICELIADYFLNPTYQIPRRRNIQIVAAPALGGIALSQWTTYHLMQGSPFSVHSPLSVYAEKSADGQAFEFRRGYADLIRGKNVLVVEDILTTSGSVAKVIDAIRELGGYVVGVGAICNRGGVTAKQLDVPYLYSVTQFEANVWEEAKCPLCQRGVEIDTDVGKGRKYLARKTQEETTSTESNTAISMGN